MGHRNSTIQMSFAVFIGTKQTSVGVRLGDTSICVSQFFISAYSSNKMWVTHRMGFLFYYPMLYHG
jgi:hypothetical protein